MGESRRPGSTTSSIERPEVTVQLEAPHLVHRLPRVSELLKDLAKQGIRSEEIVIASDFDGTLVPISPTPDEVVVPKALARILEEAAKRIPLILCSGRALGDLRAYVGDIPKLDLIGNHGGESRRWSEDGTRYTETNFKPEAWSAWRKQKLSLLRQEVGFKGGILEDKRYSVALHYRDSGTAFWGSDRGRVFLENHLVPEVRLMEGLMAWNLMPVETSKGAALARYCLDRDARVLVYFGDEKTDESVFELRGKSKLQVLSVKVGGAGPTAAHFHVDSVGEVRDWLAQLSIVDSGLK